MKRVKAACIYQTLVFQQKEDGFMSREQILSMNRAEVKRYQEGMDRTHTRYQITEQSEQEDGSIIVRVRKQYNDKADVAEYFA